MTCIIPARGGSERLPGKNIVDFFGMPIIYHVLKTVTSADLFDEIVVSTDSPKIACIVDGMVTIDMRPDRLQGDVPEFEVLRYCAERYGDDDICRVYPFAALLTPDRLRAGYELYKSGEFQTVAECQRYAHPPQRGFTLTGHEGRYLNGGIVGKRTQDLQPVYHGAGTFLFTNSGMLSVPISEHKIGWLEVGELEAQDIDTAEDLELARAKFLMRRYGR